jgi:hypothetical protein
LKSGENTRIEKFITKNIEFPRFFSYFNYSKNYIFLTLCFIKKFSFINLFEISESEVPNRIIFENSAEFQLDPPEKQSILFEKNYFEKYLIPLTQIPNLQTIIELLQLSICNKGASKLLLFLYI